jgi:hypothetical protein
MRNCVQNSLYRSGGNISCSFAENRIGVKVGTACDLTAPGAVILGTKFLRTLQGFGRRPIAVGVCWCVWYKGSSRRVFNLS